MEAVRYMRDRDFGGVIVAVTGNAMPDEINHFLAEGADLVVTSKLGVVWCFKLHTRTLSHLCACIITEPMKMNKLKMILRCFFDHEYEKHWTSADFKVIRKKIHSLSLEDAI